MMMIRTYADGSTIEMGGGNTHPPGWTGQHGNVNHWWFRKDGGEWRVNPHSARSSHHARTLIEAAENADEAWEAMYADEDREMAQEASR